MRSITIALSGLWLLTACTNQKNNFDASGSFEAVETIISAEASGTIKALDIEEGDFLPSNEIIGYIDTVQLYLKKKQLQAQINALMSKKPNIGVQLAALQEQLTAAEREKVRIDNLIKGNAATTKQLDDLNANIEVIKRQIAGQRSSLEISSSGIEMDVAPLYHQIEQVNDQLAKSIIVNPTAGKVLSKYAEANEVATVGKPLYKIANLSNLILRAYISGNQLPQVRLDQVVKVFTDDGNGGFKETTGTIVLINDKAEFTPKSIQTKDERANMVYAIKVNVVNDGTYKIGMYGEIKF